MIAETTIKKPMRLPEAAQKMNVSTSTLRRLIRDCEIEAYKIRGQWFLRDSDLSTYEEKQRSLQGGPLK